MKAIRKRLVLGIAAVVILLVVVGLVLQYRYQNGDEGLCSTTQIEGVPGQDVPVVVCP